MAAEHGSASVTTPWRSARSRSRDFFDGLLARGLDRNPIRVAARAERARASTRGRGVGGAALLARRSRLAERSFPPHDHAVGDLVPIAVPDREVLGEHVSRALDAGQQARAQRTAAQAV